ncbi:MAG: rhodanese-like domain-containing protein [Alphaproteobacteria bacterium]|nr:rhodanese-like domain-containing protein [Alphaproteobacteria bacterium]MBF0251811.1 rhodanese-like domain-containing protein [Alphaproteobacteria bacterium]
MEMNADTLQTILLVVGVFLIMRFLPRIRAMFMGIPFTDVHAVKRRLDAGENLLVIDVRTQGEFTGDLGHIQGALNLDAMALGGKLRTQGEALAPYKNDPIVVLCRTENRSPGAAGILKRNGFTNLAIMGGGMAAWNRAGYPVVHKI